MRNFSWKINIWMLCLIMIDQFSKYITSFHPYYFHYLKDINCFVISFNFCCVKNTGIAFGWLSDKFLLVQILSGVAIISGLIYAFFLKKLSFSEILMLSGGMSNMIDRLIQKGVIDFIEISLFDYSLFICNLADIFISFGLFLYVLSLHSKEKHKIL